nr:hypothetical protein Iba_chr08aCG8150 [Ipomoea batatas]GMD26875.1 hypothetical protein Iba_chr08dCG8360 [Ipomoea batatas]
MNFTMSSKYAIVSNRSFCIASSISRAKPSAVLFTFFTTCCLRAGKLETASKLSHKQRPRARRSSNVVVRIDVKSDAERPATPSPPKVPKNASRISCSNSFEAAVGLKSPIACELCTYFLPSNLLASA